MLVMGNMVVIGAVLICISTLVAPPGKIDLENQYVAELEHRTKTLQGNEPVNLTRHFDETANLALRFRTDSLITTKEYDRCLTDYVNAYAPRLSNYCFGQFGNSSWDPEDLDWMKERIIATRCMIANGKSIMEYNKPENDRFALVLKTIDRYHEARRIASAPYSGLSDARTRIARAKTLRNDDYLQHNTSLMASLRSLPATLEASHYAALRSKINSLGNYRHHSMASYDAMSDRVIAALKEYKNNARSVYGTAHDVTSLESQAARLYNEAYDYFNG